MIALFTDFGTKGPYTGQMKAALLSRAPNIPVIDLLSDAPAYDPRAASYLVAAYSMIEAFPPGTVFVCVVDPGVGSERDGLIIDADNRWYVGPDNGLFEIVMRRSERPTVWKIGLPLDTASPTFHGRDVFAPVAAGLAMGQGAKDAGGGDLMRSDAVTRFPWPDDLSEIVYVDAYGNVVTGLRSIGVKHDSQLHIENSDDKTFSNARTFSDVSPGTAFWYENSSGLVELAINGNRAADVLGLRVGMRVWVTVD